MRYEGTNLVNFTVIDGHVTKIQETPPSVKVLPAKKGARCNLHILYFSTTKPEAGTLEVLQRYRHGAHVGLVRGLMLGEVTRLCE